MLERTQAVPSGIVINTFRPAFDTGATLRNWYDEAGTAVYFKDAAEAERDADGNVQFYLWRD